MPTALTIPVDTSMLAKVDELALAAETTREAIVAQALEQFVDERAMDRLPLQEWQRERTLRGLADAERGAFVSDAEIERIVRKHDL